MGARVVERTAGQAKVLKNEFGREVMSRLNENMLKQIARAGRGFSLPLGRNGAGLLAVSDTGIGPLAKGTQVRPSKDLREYFQWPLALAIALGFWELLLSERKSKSPQPAIAPPRTRPRAQPLTEALK
jgi:hypothetical protein